MIVLDDRKIRLQLKLYNNNAIPANIRLFAVSLFRLILNGNGNLIIKSEKLKIITENIDIRRALISNSFSKIKIHTNGTTPSSNSPNAILNKLPNDL